MLGLKDLSLLRSRSITFAVYGKHRPPRRIHRASAGEAFDISWFGDTGIAIIVKFHNSQ